MMETRADPWSLGSAGSLREGKNRKSLFSKIWRLIIPPKGHRTIPTLSGYVLIFVSLAIGVAAYNTSSNILFITVSFLLSSLILSGVLSSLNFSRLTWRLIEQSPYRVNRKAFVRLEISNAKRFLTTYSLLFDMVAKLSDIKGRLPLAKRLNPERSVSLEWSFIPVNRGLETISIRSIGSQFPFGFLSKMMPADETVEVFVWPERIDYSFNPIGGSEIHFQGQTLKRKGSGEDLIGIREYQLGDPRKQINWKATARRQKLMVREMAEDKQPGYILAVDTSHQAWKREDHLEHLCRYAASLAEDLFTHNQLSATIINGDEPLMIRTMTDLEEFLNALSVVESVDHSNDVGSHRSNVITFEPVYPGGVHAMVGLQKAGQA
ncbi:DUF58 domain-containing protein [bacterium]|nr:DUF58 domain-containing protein [Opitutales bacterium]MDB2499619.1 DUF58 domain-containing protein [bacterium]